MMIIIIYIFVNEMETVMSDGWNCDLLFHVGRKKTSGSSHPHPGHHTRYKNTEKKATKAVKLQSAVPREAFPSPSSPGTTVDVVPESWPEAASCPCLSTSCGETFPSEETPPQMVELEARSDSCVVKEGWMNGRGWVKHSAFDITQVSSSDEGNHSPHHPSHTKPDRGGEARKRTLNRMMLLTI